jgi:hypothetical protein
MIERFSQMALRNACKFASREKRKMLDTRLENSEKTKRVIMFRPSLFWKSLRKPPTEHAERLYVNFWREVENTAFLGYFPEQNRYRDEIRDFNGHIWASYKTDVKYSCCRRLTDLSEECSFDLE